MRTAVILLALVGLAAVPGSLIPQRGVSSDPAAVARFTEQNPEIAPWLDRLGFFNVYSSPWFAATYLLLLISMTGCVVPRSAKLWRAVRARPPAAPHRLSRLPEYQTWPVEGDSRPVVDRAVAELRRRRFRVTVDGETVCAEKGFAREFGNLTFHLSLLGLLFGVAIGQLWGFEGRVAIAEGSGFSNVRSQYDEFTPSAFTEINNLEPFTFTLHDFRASFETSPAKRGEPRGFAADVAYTTGPGSDERRKRISPNHPLVVDGTKVFLTGHGYAPVVTVRDGRDEVVFSGPIIFLPIDPSYASDGVIKAPDAQPAQLGFEGFFLPTAAIGQNGPFSAFPGPVNPQLFLTAYYGDLGLSDGLPQSVFELDKSGLTQFKKDGTPVSAALAVGETMALPGDRGSITFDRLSRFANFQIAHDPGKELSLLAAVMLLIGLTASLTLRRRRIWIRVRPGNTPDHRVVEAASLPLTRRGAPAGELEGIQTRLRQNQLASAQTHEESNDVR